MEGLLPVGVIVILVALGVFANVIGADSREGDTDRPRRSPQGGA